MRPGLAERWRKVPTAPPASTARCPPHVAARLQLGSLAAHRSITGILTALTNSLGCPQARNEGPGAAGSGLAAGRTPWPHKLPAHRLHAATSPSAGRPRAQRAGRGRKCSSALHRALHRLCSPPQCLWCDHKTLPHRRGRARSAGLRRQRHRPPRPRPLPPTTPLPTNPRCAGKGEGAAARSQLGVKAMHTTRATRRGCPCILDPHMPDPAPAHHPACAPAAGATDRPGRRRPRPACSRPGWARGRPGPRPGTPCALSRTLMRPAPSPSPCWARSWWSGARPTAPGAAWRTAARTARCPCRVRRARAAAVDCSGAPAELHCSWC